ncbi:homocysteine-responsive endoplasmic reticulum-resident ubiquitin-like domain member 2 protein [Anopheles nili]|uniref:homocysteine-responsive endoplasmic reticulum-resident ubiquitin-like domain member 2 protein n=1 Tax=Anopheles nili TaxID=185578 RepID=UPI00237ABB92|nr:homocysteine-responsive endoplasmic reticulum-resident ubiquitin-like domain member 2 protein [Anopheles nili]
MDVTLIVKASNQQCEDLTIKCEPSWTIRRLKGHLTEVYPGKPSTDEQKLIYSGQLLNDSVVLKDVLRQYDGQQAHTVHLVFTPKNSYYGGSSSSKSNNNQSQKMSANASASTAGPSGSSSSSSGSSSSNSGGSRNNNPGSGETMSDVGNGDGLRQRTQSQATGIPRPTPRPPSIVEQTAALQNFMQETYMQYLTQYINLINGQANANALYSASGLSQVANSTDGATNMNLPSNTQQPPQPIPFVPMVQPAMTRAFPNLAYYPCMTPASYAGGLPSASSIPTPITSLNVGNGDASGSGLPGAGSSGTSFLPPSSLPGGAASTSSQQIPAPQTQGTTGTSNPTANGGAAAPTTVPTVADGEAAGTTVEQVAPQDAAPAAAPARARRFPNIVVEEQENNDWLDVFFSMCRVGILMTVIYLYSSPMRCLTVLIIGSLMLYLKKHLDRVYQAIDRRPRLQAAQDGNAAQRDQQPAVGQPNNAVPEQPQQQQIQDQQTNDAAAANDQAGANDERGESERAPTAGPSSNGANISSVAGAASAGTSASSAIVPRPRTGPASRASEPAVNVADEQPGQPPQHNRLATSADGDSGSTEQPAAEGQRMTFNDMTSFLSTLVITFFTSIIPDTPAA